MQNQEELNGTLDELMYDSGVDKYEYMKTLQDMTKGNLKQTKKIVKQFLKHNADNNYFRINIANTDYGLIFRKDSEDISEKLWEEIIDCVKSVTVSIKAFDFNHLNKESLEIWGINEDGEGVILYVFPYDNAVIGL